MRFYSLFRRLQLNSWIINREVTFSYTKILHSFVKQRGIQYYQAEEIPVVSISQIKETLHKFEVPYTVGPTCLVLKCPSCNKDNSLYVNKISGSSNCLNCNGSCDWRQVEQSLYKKSNSQLPLNGSIKEGKHLWGSLSHLSDFSSLATAKKESLLSTIGIEKAFLESLILLNPKVNLEDLSLYVPIKSGSSIVGFRRLISLSEEITTPAFTASGLISINRQSSSAIIVESVKDLLALSLDKNKKHDLICLPHGHQTLPQEVLPLLEHYKKLILWFGKEGCAWDNARIFARKLKEERCYLIRPLDDQPTPFIAHKEGYNLNKIVEKAHPVSHSSITTFAAFREDVLSELQNVDKFSGVKWTRFPQLNSTLKGHRRGELTVLTGPTGSGKTTFISEYSLDLAAQGVTTLWGSFEIRNQRLAKTMLQQYVLTPLEKNLDKFNEFADSFELLPIYFMTFHGQQPINVVMEAVEHATYVHDVAHVIIDNVQFMLGLSSSESGFLDRFYRQDALIGNFRNFATTANCHVTLVIHPRKEREGEQLTASSIFGGAKASQEADNVLIIQQKPLQSLKMKKYLQISKNRYTGDLGLMPLDFDKPSQSFAPKKGEHASQPLFSSPNICK